MPLAVLEETVAAALAAGDGGRGQSSELSTVIDTVLSIASVNGSVQCH